MNKTLRMVESRQKMLLGRYKVGVGLEVTVILSHTESWREVISQRKVDCNRVSDVDYECG